MFVDEQGESRLLLWMEVRGELPPFFWVDAAPTISAVRRQNFAAEKDFCQGILQVLP
jgi:hypothetical protein